MAPHSEHERDRALLRACKEGNPYALQELSDRYYTDIFLKLNEVLGSYGYVPDALHDMTLDCLGKLCEGTDSVMHWCDLDTAVIRLAASYARVELVKALRQKP
ncbi:MAG TPA: hypothetical protein VNI54_10490 [Thermoanaerobaculia bacterium]|nr:hypothetical protein [Thermoanaerobaculia bacterium]